MGNKYYVLHGLLSRMSRIGRKELATGTKGQVATLFTQLPGRSLLGNSLAGFCISRTKQGYDPRTMNTGALMKIQYVVLLDRYSLPRPCD